MSLAAAAVLVAGLHVAAVPSADYSVGDAAVTVTVVVNPSDYRVRAWLECNNAVVRYGGWHVTGTSAASCGGGYDAVMAGVQYDRARAYGVFCWAEGDPRLGSC